MASGELVRYRGLVYDSARWRGFDLRPGDIVVTTPPKCGTTWAQMICVLLVHQRAELGRPLSELSPWLDMTSTARRDVVATLGAQRHRRVIKTHTPLDGLPIEPGVTYLGVGRDPRDVALSMDNHLDNLDVGAFAAARAEAAAIDGVAIDPIEPPPPRAATPEARFWSWVESDVAPTGVASSLLRTLRHLQTCVDPPSGADVVLLHYDELRGDLAGQMRGLADRLGIDVPAGRWPELVRAATFDEMRARADVTAPNANRGAWHDSARFFNRGTSGQWRTLLDAGGLDRYRARVAAIGTPEAAGWVHRPPL